MSTSGVGGIKNYQLCSNDTMLLVCCRGRSGSTEVESETDTDARADASGSCEAASQLQGSFPDSATNSKSKAATDLFQDEDHLVTDRTLEKHIRRAGEDV